MSFCMAGPGRRKGCVCTLPKVRKHEGLAAVLKALAGMGHVKKTCKHAFRVRLITGEILTQTYLEVGALIS